MQLSEIPQGVTQLLKAWSSGDQAAFEAIIGLVYDHLRGEARRQLGQIRYHDMLVQPTQLVHEAYLKFRSENLPVFVSRNDFEWFASRIIRNVLVDHIRAMNRHKRKAGSLVPLDEVHGREGKELQAGKLDPELFLGISQALDRLEMINPRQSQIVALRFIMGRTIAETASILDISATTVKTEWQAAQLWLFNHLHASET